jgi:hypothetical protein
VVDLADTIIQHASVEDEFHSAAFKLATFQLIYENLQKHISQWQLDIHHKNNRGILCQLSIFKKRENENVVQEISPETPSNNAALILG